MKRSLLVSIIAAALAIIGVVFYLARPRADEAENVPVRDASAAAQPAAEPGSAPSALVSCTGPINSQDSISGLDARHKWARSLIQANHVDAGLTELRNIAAINPGYPAINLEIGDGLIKVKRSAEAKDSLKLQIEISECLSNLPQSDIQKYCRSEWASEPQTGCVLELAKINQQAHYEEGLVDSDLARNGGKQPTPVTAASAVVPPRPKPATPAPAKVLPAAATAPAAAEVAAATPPVAPAPAPKPVAPINIKSAEAPDHVGQLATVCGSIVSKHTAEESNGKPTFVNLDRTFPNQTFTVVFWGTDAAAVGDFPSTGSVCVTGTVAMYRGNPQIVIHDAKNWSAH